MSGKFFDQLFAGTVSRRDFLEKVTGAAAALPVLATPLAAAALPQQQAPESRNKVGMEMVQPNKYPDLRESDHPIYSPANIGGGGRVERNFYRRWTKVSQVPMVEGYSILDARTQPVLPWPDIEGRGMYLNFSGNVHMDAVIYEIPEGKALAERRSFYEQNIICLGGRGYTTVGDSLHSNKVQWGEGALFSIPLNVPHRHFNADPAHPARLLAITTFPFMVQIFGTLAAIYDLPFDFTDRYDGAPDYFTRTVRIRKRWDKTNFVPDIRKSPVVEWSERGEGNASMFWDMGGQTILEPHMSQFDVGTYKLGHRHPYEAIILTLNGRGYSIAGKDGLKQSESVKLDWQTGSIISPPFYWYHQHFNTGQTKARYFAMTEGDFPKRLGIPLEVQQIESAQEDPEIKKRFLEELKRAGILPVNLKDIQHAHNHDHAGPGHTHDHDHSHNG